MRASHTRSIARAIVFDDEGFLYFCGVTRNDMFADGSFIETSGGGVEDNESLKSAVMRELSEELGAQVDVIDEIAFVKDYYNAIFRENHNHYFLCRVRSFGQRSLTEYEKSKVTLCVLKLRFDEALREYESRKDTRWGNLLYNREVPVLLHASEILTDMGVRL